MTVTALPEALSDPVRRFLEAQHLLLIGGERVPAEDGRLEEYLETKTVWVSLG